MHACAYGNGRTVSTDQDSLDNIELRSCLYSRTYSAADNMLFRVNAITITISNFQLVMCEVMESFHNTATALYTIIQTKFHYCNHVNSALQCTKGYVLDLDY